MFCTAVRRSKGLRTAILALMLLMCAVAAGCGGDNQEQGEKDRKQAEQEVKRQQNDGAEIRMLAGGSETNNRVLQPGNNMELQRKFPNDLVLRGSLHSNQIALTFDDGPDRRFTPKVLDILKKHQVKATFFLMGARVKGVPDIAKRIADEGHAIGNHTYWHPKLWQESEGRIRWEVMQTDEEIRKITGYSPRLFRAPYGGLTEKMVEDLSKMNYSIIGWSVDSLDWSQIPADQVERNVMSNIHPGAIVLMHSGGHWTQDLSGMIEALDRIIPKLKKEGFQFVTIPDMFRLPLEK